MRSWLAIALLLGGCLDGLPPLDPVDAAPVDAAPAPAPDLRFKMIGATPDAFVWTCILGFDTPCLTNIGGGDGISGKSGDWPAPPELYAPGATPGVGHSWNVISFAPAAAMEPLEWTSTSGYAVHLQAKLDELLARHMVVTALDLEDEEYALTAAAVVSGQPAYETPGAVELPRAELDAWVAAEGATGRVVTAVAARAGLVHAFSFARAGDTIAYETRVADATLATLSERAQSLADGGYTLTAFGQIGTDAFLLVGTRAPGAAPREVYFESADYAGRDALVHGALDHGFAIVGMILDEDLRYFVLGQR